MGSVDNVLERKKIKRDGFLKDQTKGGDPLDDFLDIFPVVESSHTLRTLVICVGCERDLW